MPKTSPISSSSAPTPTQEVSESGPSREPRTLPSSESLQLFQKARNYPTKGPNSDLTSAQWKASNELKKTLEWQGISIPWTILVKNPEHAAKLENAINATVARLSTQKQFEQDLRVAVKKLGEKSEIEPFPDVS